MSTEAHRREESVAVERQLLICRVSLPQDINNQTRRIVEGQDIKDRLGSPDINQEPAETVSAFQAEAHPVVAATEQVA